MTLENFFRIARWRSEGRNDMPSLWYATRAVAWSRWIYRSRQPQ